MLVIIEWFVGSSSASSPIDCRCLPFLVPVSFLRVVWRPESEFENVSLLAVVKENVSLSTLIKEDAISSTLVGGDPFDHGLMTAVACGYR